eukprot:9178751-Pyramimonas_sp.AAC.1
MPSGSPGGAPCGGRAQRREYSQAVVLKLLTFICNYTVLCHTRVHARNSPARRFSHTQTHSRSCSPAFSLPTYSDQSFSF